MAATTVRATTPRARTLAAALRDARTSRNIGLRNLSRSIGISHTLVSQWENGHRLPTTENVATVLTGIGVDATERDRLIELARHAGENDWLTAGIPGMTEQMAGMLECERDAVHITDWAPLMIPGLLQTSDYARAIIGASGAARSEVEPRVLFRAGRRDILSANPPTRLTVLLGEPALYLQVGGAAVLADQLRHLLKAVGDMENVTVRVVPSSRPWHPGSAGPFVLYEFDAGPPIVLLEHHRSSVFLYNDSDLSAYHDARDTLQRDMAMSPDESLELIAAVAGRLE